MDNLRVWNANAGRQMLILRSVARIDNSALLKCNLVYVVNECASHYYGDVMYDRTSIREACQFGECIS